MTAKDLVDSDKEKIFWICAYTYNKKLKDIVYDLTPTCVIFENSNNTDVIFRWYNYEKKEKRNRLIKSYKKENFYDKLFVFETKEECIKYYKKLVRDNIELMKSRLEIITYNYNQRIKKCENKINNF